MTGKPKLILKLVIIGIAPSASVHGPILKVHRIAIMEKGA